jgi:arylsulfatase
MADTRPNIILIITDQQRYDTIAALGFPHMDTPNLDRLVNEGTVFTNSFITSASCAPARASLFTGYYPHTTGVYKNADTWQHGWVEDLNTSGYHCVNIGKMHTYPFETPMGFHERFVVENKDRYLEGRYFFDRWDMSMQARGETKQQRESYRQRSDYKERLGAFEWELPEDLHSDVFVGNMALWWIDQKPALDKPIFMEIGFPGPHPPYDPVPRYAEPYLNKELPIDKPTQEQLDGQPSCQKELRVHNSEIDHDSVAWSLDPTDEQLHRQRAYYLANVTMIDEKIGEILDALEKKGILENSVVIFTPDHGDCLGDHGHSQKWTMYDTITRSPLIVWAPGRWEGGRKIDTLVQQFDVGPAILELAGIPVPETFEAQSLTPLLDGEDAPGREYVFAEQRRDGILTGCEMMTMVRSKEWKLVHYLGNDDGELYDMVGDPKEHKNLWHTPEHQERKQEMLTVLSEWYMRSRMDAADWAEPWR